MDTEITSTSNSRIKALARLHRRRERDRSGRFLIEGLREIERAVAAGIVLDEVLVAPELVTDRNRPAVDRITNRHATTTVSAAVMAHLSRRQNPPPTLAAGIRVERELEDLELGDDPLVLIAEGVEKPGNLGAMVRTADAVGADAVITVSPGTDWTNPNVIRASQGAVFSVPTVAAPVDSVIAFLRARRIDLICLVPGAPKDIWDADLSGAVAIAVGAEDVGLSSPLSAAGPEVQIPMAGAADSLNAASSAAVALYEAVRQRR